MFDPKKDNKNIFQVCINLNDNIDSLKESRKKLLDLNSSYDYHYIDSEDLLNEIMTNKFKNSPDIFDQKIYKCFSSVSSVLSLGEKARKCKNIYQADEAQKVCILVCKTDIFRLAVIYKYGGLYLDLSKSFEMDIDEEFSKNDVILVRSGAEIHTSIIYAKKNNIVIKKLLETAIENCLCHDKCLTNMNLAGPSMYASVIKNMCNDFDLASVGDFFLSGYNGKILYNGGSKKYLKFRTPWREKLHEPDLYNEKTKPNAHWLFEDF